MERNSIVTEIIFVLGVLLFCLALLASLPSETEIEICVSDDGIKAVSIWETGEYVIEFEERYILVVIREGGTGAITHGGPLPVGTYTAHRTSEL